MVVTKTHMQGNAYEDARKVVEAIVAKRQNPRNTLIRPDRIYVSIASSYNGSRPNLDRQIMKIAEMYGVDSITALDFLHLAYDEFEAERRALGDTRQYATDEQAVLEAIAERTSGEGLKHMDTLQAIGQGRLEADFVKEAENKLDAFFGI